MKKFTQILKPVLALVILAITFIACDKDYTSLESDIQGVQNFDVVTEKFPVTAYNQKMGPVQTDNLSSNLLGVYDDPIYGKTTASIVTQLVPTSNNYNPDFGENPQVESVILNIPYYSTRIETDNEGNSTYKLDSLFGTEPIKIFIYKNDYFLADYNSESDFSEDEKYYSNANQTINFDSHNAELLYKNEDFLPNASEHLIEVLDENGDVVETNRLTPSLRVHLEDLPEENPNPFFWHELFFQNQDSPVLSNANNFKNFFRGLYLRVEPVNDDGLSFMLDFNNTSASLTLLYTNDDSAPNELLDYTMRFANVNRLNLFENDPSNTIIENAANNANQIDGDETLYLKGGEGAFAVIDLFAGEDNNGVEDGDGLSDNYEAFLASFIDERGHAKKLINEASITFHVDQTIVNGKEPDRVTLYDLKNNVPIADYYYDTNTNSVNPQYSRNQFSRVLERNESNEGVKYKISVTEHLNNIIHRDSTNLKLGLFVTTNIENTTISDVLNEDYTVSNGTVLSPRGTAIYGSNTNVPEDKRLQLEINYTDPNQ
ncbi:DUF4270 domain-containing protein [Mangrovimonas cancribranchiae]|uniref:DUF4270 domain-containing protein n=1 Tax=Mangrovimonas cancribranchiae TaxID=3080055 RepID=A0AAU6P7H4_9FLAO